MGNCLTKEMKMPSLMEMVIKGKGFILNEPFINEVNNVNIELRMNNIHNQKKFMIDEDDESGHSHRRHESKRMDQQMIGVKEDQQWMTRVMEEQLMTQVKKEQFRD